MASIYCSSSHTTSTNSILGFRNLCFKNDAFLNKVPNFSPNLHFTPLNFRFKKPLKLSISQRLLPLHASISPTEGSLPEKSEETKANAASTAQGPPLLTIFAGFVVLFIVFLVVKSIALWLLSFVFVFPGSK